jgi:hypothetical protein
MPVTLRLANAVRRLGRDGMNVGEIAATLGRPAADILETLCMLGLPLPGERADAGPMPSDRERAALRANMPKKWQDRRGD